MAQHAVRSGRASIKQACLAFSVSMSCYRYQSRLSSENAVIAGHLIRLTRDKFDSDEYRLLVVANKYLTGFDQPKLCAMYVSSTYSPCRRCHASIAPRRS